MNLTDLQEICFRHLGLQEVGSRPDWRRQEVKDAINTAIEEIAASGPYLWTLVRESTIAVVNGTNVYTLNDWCKRPLMLWTETTSAHKVRFTNYRQSTRDGSRNSSATYTQFGPWEVTWYPRNTAGAKSGAAATASEGTTAITGLAGLDATDVGRMIRLNGESDDYQITAQATTSCTVDKAIRSRRTGVTLNGAGAGYTGVRWEVGPPGRYRITMRPTPNAASTLYYSFLAQPRRLINAEDTPEIPDEFHHLIWKGAISKLAMFDKDPGVYQTFGAEYAAGIEMLKAADSDDMDGEDAPHYDSMLDVGYNRPLPQDVYLRGGIN